ncbi:hypothetical protein [Brucella pituitosa]|uniref:hypothetical protein n=1 Tax=Brucella pituitosa TaxID=571256 RepID=UPI000C27A975|nr:hypothetical protein [Brucella pituitosa]PJO47194.1 hypothetical protein CWE02_19210 [Brucella pituitosa]
MAKARSVTSAAAIRDEIAVLEDRAETLAARIAHVKRALAISKSARVKALAADPSTDVSEISDQVRSDSDELELLTDAVADVASALEGAHRQLEEAEDREARNKAASDLKTIADGLEPHARAIDEAVGHIAIAVAAIEAAFPDRFAFAEFRKGRPFADNTYGNIVARDVANAILADALASAVPSAFTRIYPEQGNGVLWVLPRMKALTTAYAGWVMLTGEHPPLSAINLAGNVSEHLNKRATAIVSGQASPDIANGHPWPMSKKYQIEEGLIPDPYWEAWFAHRPK